MTTETAMDLYSRCCREIEDFHVYLVKCFNGRLSGEAAYRLSGHAKGFVYITPDGVEIDFTTLRGAMAGWSGSDVGMEIAIRDIRARFCGDDHCLVTYEEWQKSAAGVENLRISTALFIRDDDAPNGVVWLHLHEAFRY